MILIDGGRGNICIYIHGWLIWMAQLTAPWELFVNLLAVDILVDNISGTISGANQKACQWLCPSEHWLL